MTTPSRLIINSPFAEPTEHWIHDREAKTFHRKAESWPAGYVIASEDSKASGAAMLHWYMAVILHRYGRVWRMWETRIFAPEDQVVKQERNG